MHIEGVNYVFANQSRITGLLKTLNTPYKQYGTIYCLFQLLMGQCCNCFAVKHQICIVDNKTSPDCLHEGEQITTEFSVFQIIISFKNVIKHDFVFHILWLILSTDSALVHCQFVIYEEEVTQTQPAVYCMLSSCVTSISGQEYVRGKYTNILLVTKTRMSVIGYFFFFFFSQEQSDKTENYLSFLVSCS